MEFVKIANGIWKGRIGTPEPHTPVAYRPFPMQEEALGLLGEGSLPEVAKDVTVRSNPRGLQIMLPMDKEEAVYGFGLQLHSLNQAGRKRTLRVNADAVADTGESHAPVPFYVSTAGYGLLVDTFRHVDFYMGTHVEKGRSAWRSEVNQVQEEFSEAVIYGRKKNTESRAVIIDLKAVDGVEVYLFAGNVRQAVQRYNLFSGGGCLPPMWGLGIWYRAYGGSSQETVEKLAQGFREEKMPVDVLGLEPGWHTHSYSCTYQWSDLFPEPRKLIDGLSAQGYKVNLWEHIFVYPMAPFYEEMLSHAGEYEVWNGLVPDLATPEARKIFADYHREELVKKGIRGFKLDECDNSDYTGNWSFPDTAQFPSGMDGEQMHAAIGGLYQAALYETFRQEDKRTYSQVRASWALAAPLPFVLYSDLYDHKQFIRGMVTSGFSGLLWAPEVRDCRDGRDLLRRMESLMFSAHAIYNCWYITHPAWKQVDTRKNLAGEFMEDADYYTDVCRKYHEIRMSLLPYLYSAFVKYWKEGIPPIRALVMDYEEDLQARNVDDEYLFGDSLLVAPMTLEDGTWRKVYLPAGKWHDFWEGDIRVSDVPEQGAPEKDAPESQWPEWKVPEGHVLEGGKAYLIRADYDRIPVFVRDGSILPLAEPVACVTADTVFSIHPKVYGDGGEGCLLYEDDFETFAYEEGRQNCLRLWAEGDGRIRTERTGCERERYRVME